MSTTSGSRSVTGMARGSECHDSASSYVDLLRRKYKEMSMDDCHIKLARSESSDTHTCSCRCGRAVD